MIMLINNILLKLDNILKLTIISIFTLQLSICYAAAVNINKLIAKIQQKTNIPVLFPSSTPKIKYYPFVKITNSGYIIYLDATKDCGGVHACNIGMVSAEIAGNPIIYYDMNNKELTEAVKLANNLKGYYTPGHAMGDYWPANIVWRDRNVLYSITWQLDPKIERATIIAMANSMIIKR
jgi:hypothetical protein